MKFNSSKGFNFSGYTKSIKTYTIDGTDFINSYKTINKALKEIRNKRSPILIHAKVPAFP